MSRQLSRIVAILNCFTVEHPTVSLSEIADRSHLDPSTAHRILASLNEFRIVRRDPLTKRYSLGTTIMDWGARAFATVDVRSVADPVMRQLNDRTRETISLYLREGIEFICIAVYDSPQQVRHNLWLGRRLPPLLGASGKLLAALMPESQMRAIAKENSTLTDDECDRLLAEVATIRERGYSVSVQEVVVDGWSIAAPIHDRKGELVASLVVAGPVSRLDANTFESCAELLLSSARTVSRAMGAPAEVVDVDGIVVSCEEVSWIGTGSPSNA